MQNLNYLEEAIKATDAPTNSQTEADQSAEITDEELLAYEATFDSGAELPNIIKKVQDYAMTQASLAASDRLAYRNEDGTLKPDNDAVQRVSVFSYTVIANLIEAANHTPEGRRLLRHMEGRAQEFYARAQAAIVQAEVIKERDLEEARRVDGMMVMIGMAQPGSKSTEMGVLEAIEKDKKNKGQPEGQP